MMVVVVVAVVVDLSLSINIKIFSLKKFHSKKMKIKK